MKYEGKIYGKVAGKYIQLDVNPNLVDAAPELLEALKKIRGVEVWIQDREMKELFQKIVYSAIKNAEKKQQ